MLLEDRGRPPTLSVREGLLKDQLCRIEGPPTLCRQTHKDHLCCCRIEGPPKTLSTDIEECKIYLRSRVCGQHMC